jgi:hypothetical protein
MGELLGLVTVIVGASVLWVAGLRLFLSSGLTRAKKIRWSAILVIVGFGIGVVLPLGQLWSKFLVVLLVLPALALADVLLLRSGRGVSFWVRACGFEVVTVFAAAATARMLLDLAGAAALGQSVR